MASIYSSDYKRLLGRLREGRLAAGLTQAEVARAFGRPQSFVAKCESGERRIDAVELARFADLYGRPLEHFVGRLTHGAAVTAESDGTRRRRARSRRARPVRSRR